MAPHEIDRVLPGPAFSVRGQDGYTVVTIGGEIDIASAPVLREQIFATVAEAVGAPAHHGVREPGVPEPRAGWPAQYAIGELHGTATGG
jgi:hypothetical protein